MSVGVWVLAFVLGIATIVAIWRFTVHYRHRTYEPFSDGTPTNDFQVFDTTFSPSPVRAALTSFKAERGGLNFPPGPVKLTFDWDWPRPPAVSSPALKHVAYGTWSNEEWRLFMKAWRER